MERIKEEDAGISIARTGRRYASMRLDKSGPLLQSIDADGKILDVSSGWLTATGYSRDEVIGCDFISFFTTDSFPGEKNGFLWLKECGIVDSASLTMKRKDRDNAQVELSATPHYDNDGLLESVVCEIEMLELEHDADSMDDAGAGKWPLYKSVLEIINSVSKYPAKYSEHTELIRAIRDKISTIDGIEFTFVDGVAEDDEHFTDIIDCLQFEFDGVLTGDRRIAFPGEAIQDLPDILPVDYLLMFRLNIDVDRKEIFHMLLGIKSDLDATEWIELLQPLLSVTELTLCDLALRLEKMALSRELEHAAITDPLTRLYNRAKLNQILVGNQHIMTSYQVPCSLILIDIDDFREVNEAVGPNVGDEVLQQFSRILLGRVRKTDHVGRWGGEEYLVVLPYTDIKQAIMVAESVRLAVECSVFVGGIHRTASFGVSGMTKNGNVVDAIEQADLALRRAKQSGKNSVCSFDREDS